MPKIIQCVSKTKTESQNIRVKVIKAPLVDSNQLRKIIFSRARAIVL